MNSNCMLLLHVHIIEGVPRPMGLGESPSHFLSLSSPPFSPTSVLSSKINSSSLPLSWQPLSSSEPSSLLMVKLWREGGRRRQRGGREGGEEGEGGGEGGEGGEEIETRQLTLPMGIKTNQFAPTEDIQCSFFPCEPLRIPTTACPYLHSFNMDSSHLTSTI